MLIEVGLKGGVPGLWEGWGKPQGLCRHSHTEGALRAWVYNLLSPNFRAVALVPGGTVDRKHRTRNWNRSMKTLEIWQVHCSSISFFLDHPVWFLTRVLLTSFSKTGFLSFCQFYIWENDSIKKQLAIDSDGVNGVIGV